MRAVFEEILLHAKIAVAIICGLDEREVGHDLRMTEDLGLVRSEIDLIHRKLEQLLGLGEGDLKVAEDVDLATIQSLAERVRRQMERR